jgi:hypothetical protein
VMIRETLDPGSRFAGVYATPGNGVRYQARLLNGGSVTSDTPIATAEQKALTAPVWVRLERNGASFNGYYSTDGSKWTAMVLNPQTQSLAMVGTVYIGLVVSSHVSGVGCTAQFSNISTSSGISGPWQFAEIGIDHALNDRVPLYVTLKDSAGHGTVMTNSDADAVLRDTWQAWNIPLADLRKAGVNPAAIKTMALGMGDPKAPSAGGNGKIFIDDIGFGRSASGSSQ